jgi:hypothetical protein
MNPVVNGASSAAATSRKTPSFERARLKWLLKANKLLIFQ